MPFTIHGHKYEDLVPEHAEEAADIMADAGDEAGDGSFESLAGSLRRRVERIAALSSEDFELLRGHEGALWDLLHPLMDYGGADDFEPAITNALEQAELSKTIEAEPAPEPVPEREVPLRERPIEELTGEDYWRRQYNDIAHAPRKPSRFDDLRPEDFGADDHCYGTTIWKGAPAWVHEGTAWMSDHLRQNLVDIARTDHWPAKNIRGSGPYPRYWRSYSADGTETKASVRDRKKRETVLAEARAKIAKERAE